MPIALAKTTERKRSISPSSFYRHLPRLLFIRVSLIYLLYRWVYKTLGLCPLVVEHSVVVMTAGSQLRRSQIESYE